MAGNESGAVVVTGASTGIGRATALLLDRRGYRVFAGVRRDEDAKSLSEQGSERLEPLKIDVAKQRSISAARKRVEDVAGSGRLVGLVNNAGVGGGGPIEFMDLDELRKVLEVNLIGQVAVTQAFLPLIRRGKGRIVNVGSIGGRVVLPLHGAYSASKFGMEAVSDALRLELRQWHIPVSHIDPGATETAIFGKTLAEIDAVKKRLGEQGETEYDAQLASIRKLVEKTAAHAAPVEDLSKTVAKALTAKKPKSRYHAGSGAEAAIALARTASDGMKDRAVAHEAHLPAPE